MLVKLWRKGNPSALLVGMQTGAATVETICNFLKKLKMELPFDPATPLLGLYPNIPETQIQKNLCTPIFIAAQFTIAKCCEQPKCSSISKWVDQKTVVHLCKGILCSRKKEGAYTLCYNTDGTGEHYAKWNKRGGEGQIPCDLTFNWNIIKRSKKEQL